MEKCIDKIYDLCVTTFGLNVAKSMIDRAYSHAGRLGFDDVQREALVFRLLKKALDEYQEKPKGR